MKKLSLFIFIIMLIILIYPFSAYCEDNVNTINDDIVMEVEEEKKEEKSIEEQTKEIPLEQNNELEFNSMEVTNTEEKTEEIQLEETNKIELNSTEITSMRKTEKIEEVDKTASILYHTHIQDIGWEKDFIRDGNTSGTSHQSKRLEAIQIKLYGEIENYYDVYYRVHAQNFGWMGWAKNGEKAGTAGYAYRLEAIEIVLVKKGENPPTRTDTTTAKTFKERTV